MRKIVVSLFCCVLILSSCLETATHTTIKEDGSGMMLATVDLSQGMKMLMEGKKPPGNAVDLFLDTTIYVRNHSDTATILTARQKELLREMMIKFRMDFRDMEKVVFSVSIVTLFNSFDDLNDLNTLMKQEEYDIIFNRAFKIPILDDKESGSKNPNDNLFGSVFPGFFNCDYKMGSITCAVDMQAYDKTLADLKQMEFDLNGEMEAKMFGSARFTNMLTLPVKPKSIKGDSWRRGEKENVLVQQGSLLDIYKEPGKYAYTILY